MEIYWTLQAQDDLERIYRFALQYSRQHADEVLDRLITGCAGLTEHPVIGVQQTRYAPREVRKVVFDDYEVHYELRKNDIYIVDLGIPKKNDEEILFILAGISYLEQPVLSTNR